MEESICTGIIDSCGLEGKGGFGVVVRGRGRRVGMANRHFYYAGQIDDHAEEWKRIRRREAMRRRDEDKERAQDEREGMKG
eukprot:762929-Hanusia_phi.AAC.5